MGRGLLLALAALGTALCLLVAVLATFPEMNPALLRVPRSLDDAKQLREVLSHYTDTHYFAVISGFCLVFLLLLDGHCLQTFCIPGTIFLSFLSGALFGLPFGFALTILMSTLGASSCYLLSRLLGVSVVMSIMPTKIAWFRAELEKHRAHLFNFMFFLRISPLLPNWFVNLASPVLGVPLHIFVLATALGVMPQTFLCVRAGRTLQTLQSTSDVINFRVLLMLALIALLPLIPTLKPVQRSMRKWFKLD